MVPLLTHEQVICIRIRSSNFEELHQVMKLTMYIAAYSDGAFLADGQFHVGRRSLLGLTTGWTFDSSWSTSLAYSSVHDKQEKFKSFGSRVSCLRGSPTLSHSL